MRGCLKRFQLPEQLTSAHSTDDENCTDLATVLAIVDLPLHDPTLINANILMSANNTKDADYAVIVKNHFALFAFFADTT